MTCLIYREEIKLMFCTYCEDQGENGSFVSRCNNFRVDALNAHVGKGNFSSDLEEKILFLINILLFQIHSECRIWGLIFQNFLGGACLEGSDQFMIINRWPTFFWSSNFFRASNISFLLALPKLFGTDCNEN
jgi:hypothetical protein